jgi:hypothetical protein
VLGLPAPDVDAQERGVAVARVAVLLDPLGDRQPQVGDGDAGVGEAELGVVDQVADDGGVTCFCQLLSMLTAIGPADGVAFEAVQLGLPPTRRDPSPLQHPPHPQ